MASYKTLFNVNLQHSFFNESECRVLSFIPTNFTTRFLHNADLVIKTVKQGISVSYNTDFTKSLEAYFDDDIVFSFIIKSRDPYFYNYTDFDHVKGKSLYFNSAQTREKDDELILSNEDFVTAIDEKVIDDNVFDDILSKQDRISNPVGIVIIRLSDLITEDIIPSSYIAKKYRINFNAKSTFWRYNLIKRNDIDYDKLFIQDIEQKIKFDQKGQVSLSNGVIANQIESDQAIMLKEFSDCQLNLIGIKDKKEKILIKRLNVPDTKQYKIEQEKKISDLYVYY